MRVENATSDTLLVIPGNCLVDYHVVDHRDRACRARRLAGQRAALDVSTRTTRALYAQHRTHRPVEPSRLRRIRRFACVINRLATRGVAARPARSPALSRLCRLSGQARTERREREIASLFSIRFATHMLGTAQMPTRRGVSLRGCCFRIGCLGGSHGDRPHFERRLRGGSREVILESIADAILTSDDAGNVTYLNLAAEAMTGWTRSEAEGRSVGEVLQIVDGSTRERLVCDPLRLAIELRKPVALGANSILVRREASNSSLRTLPLQSATETGASSVRSSCFMTSAKYARTRSGCRISRAMTSSRTYRTPFCCAVKLPVS